MTPLSMYRAGMRTPEVVAYHKAYRKAQRARDSIAHGRPPGVSGQPAWLRERMEYEKAMRSWVTH